MCPQFCKRLPSITLHQFSNRSSDVRRRITAVGAKLTFLPPYSPVFNPIEQVFPKVKHWLRMAQAHSVEAIHRYIEKLVGSIPQTGCVDYG